MLDAAGVDDPERRAELDALLAHRSRDAGDHSRARRRLSSGRRRAAICCAHRTSCRPAAICTASIRSGIPSAFAVRDGARQADRLLARHAKDGQALPETVAMVLWGTDNLKTEGGPIAQVLWLMGAEPRHDSYGRLTGAKLIPLDRSAARASTWWSRCRAFSATCCRCRPS